MKNRHIGAAVLTLAFVLVRCGSPTSPTAPLNRTMLKAASLRLIASMSGPSGGIVTFGIGLENGAATTQNLAFTDAQFFDIEVSDGGDVVWSWSHGKYFAQAGWDLELHAGESYVRDATWDLKDNNGRNVPSGAYKCRIWITSSPRDEALVSETTLTI